ncbi:uncharacterized protein LOC109596653 isoform X3 [Aethina tumida]|uniref:uncharacterized protein LOC109596653 isoform X3 n=1 Tax=Aethina tumida TaxID=116153 RepID=UPI0021499643|nr:uncharacterized protein LOC109596653 isoform X3 [Aethina tumida]
MECLRKQFKLQFIEVNRLRFLKTRFPLLAYYFDFFISAVCCMCLLIFVYISMIITGAIGIGVISMVSIIIEFIRGFVPEQNPMNTVLRGFGIFLFTVEFVIFCLGSYLVFSVFEPSYEEVDEFEYCAKWLYVFAITYIALTFAIVLSALLLGYCFLYLWCFTVAAHEEQQQPRRQPAA